MQSRLSLLLLVAFLLIGGCTPTREISYSLKDINTYYTSDSLYLNTLRVTLSIEPFADVRQQVADNGILFVRGRETELNEKDYCINSEEHYASDKVTTQVASTIAGHLGKRRTFKSVVSVSKEVSDYYLTGKLKRLFGEQEFSSAARTGSYFGLIGALATAGATTNANVLIEFTDLVLYRKSDGATMKLEDVNESFTGEMPADAYCWCIYDNVNDQLKAAVEKFAVKVEHAVAEMELSKH